MTYASMIATVKRNEGKLEQKTEAKIRTEKAEAKEMAAGAASQYTRGGDSSLPLEDTILFYTT